MINIKLKQTFKYDHTGFEVGEIIGVRPDIAARLVAFDLAEYAEPQHAVVQPQETRASVGSIPPENSHVPEYAVSADLPRRRPGRPPRQPQEKV